MSHPCTDRNGDWMFERAWYHSQIPYNVPQCEPRLGVIAENDVWLELGEHIGRSIVLYHLNLGVPRLLIQNIAYPTVENCVTVKCQCQTERIKAIKMTNQLTSELHTLECKTWTFDRWSSVFCSLTDHLCTEGNLNCQPTTTHTHQAPLRWITVRSYSSQAWWTLPYAHCVATTKQNTKQQSTNRKFTHS